jgi:hypothetical protein
MWLTGCRKLLRRGKRNNLLRHRRLYRLIRLLLRLQGYRLGRCRLDRLRRWDHRLGWLVGWGFLGCRLRRWGWGWGWGWGVDILRRRRLVVFLRPLRLGCVRRHHHLLVEYC